MKLACIASQSCTELGPAQPQLVSCLYCLLTIFSYMKVKASTKIKDILEIRFVRKSFENTLPYCEVFKLNTIVSRLVAIIFPYKLFSFLSVYYWSASSGLASQRRTMPWPMVCIKSINVHLSELGSP